MKSSVGVRQLRAELARYVARAGDGETIVVTIAGRPAARLCPLEAAQVDSLVGLAARGRVRRPSRSESESESPTTGPDPIAAPVDSDVARMMARIRG